MSRYWIEKSDFRTQGEISFRCYPLARIERRRDMTTNSNSLCELETQPITPEQRRNKMKCYNTTRPKDSADIERINNCLRAVLARKRLNLFWSAVRGDFLGRHRR
jgi:hypothetical protein